MTHTCHHLNKAILYMSELQLYCTIDEKQNESELRDNLCSTYYSLSFSEYLVKISQLPDALSVVSGVE